MKVERTWYASPDGLTLKHQATVGGERFQAAVTTPHNNNMAPMPSGYIEHELRRTLMYEIEKRIYGNGQ